MINMIEATETIKMITQENLDVRTITLGISLLDCIDSDLKKLNENIYRKITETAKDLVSVGQAIEREYGIPIVNKRISVTPIALIGGSACQAPEDYVTIAQTLDRAAKEVGVNFIGGFSCSENLQLIKDKTKIFENKLQESDRDIIFEGMDNILSDIFINKIWNMIYERYKIYENL